MLKEVRPANVLSEEVSSPPVEVEVVELSEVGVEEEEVEETLSVEQDAKLQTVMRAMRLVTNFFFMNSNPLYVLFVKNSQLRYSY